MFEKFTYCRYFTGSHPTSSFDVVLSGVIFPQSISHGIELLAEYLRLVKPKGRIILQEATVLNPIGTQLKTVEKLQSVMKISGLTNIQELKFISLTDAEIQTLKDLLNVTLNVSVVEIQCQKPNFEVISYFFVVNVSVCLYVPVHMKCGCPSCDARAGR